MKKTDSEIEQWVLKELALQRDLGSSEICVQSHDAVVTLNGTVPTLAGKLAAALAVNRLSGIAGLANQLKIDARLTRWRVRVRPLPVKTKRSVSHKLRSKAVHSHQN